MNDYDAYFRQLDRLNERENFLEKEMLDSDVHHLEVRTAFFDKLAVLAAGTLALGITFLATGYQNESLRHVIHQHISWLSSAMFFVLLSLIPCVIHNFLISRAVSLLSKQVEFTYKAAQTKREGLEMNPSGMCVPLTAKTRIQNFEYESNQLGKKKETIVTCTAVVGVLAVLSLFIGYCLGLASVVDLFVNAQ